MIQKIRLSMPKITAGALVLFALPVFVLWRLNANRGDSPGPNAPLSLRAEHAGQDVLISWNRAAAARLQARRAYMTISDGEARQQIALDSTELETGRIMYTPRSGDTAIRLDLHLADKTVSESIRILGATPATPASPAAAAEPPRSPDPAPAEAKPEPPKVAEQPPTPKPEIIAAARPVPHASFVPPPSQAQERRPEIEQPPEVGARVEMGRQGMPQADLPGPAPAPAVLAPSMPAGTLVIQVTPPVPVRRVQPEVPTRVRSLLTSLHHPVVIVDVEVEVDTNGAVRDARMLRVSADPSATRAGLEQQLVLASLNAARNWQFQPATRDGKPIPARSTINFHFVQAKTQ